MLNDMELRMVKNSSGRVPMPMFYYRWLFGELICRKVTNEEVRDAITQLNGPGEPGTTYKDLERNG